MTRPELVAGLLVVDAGPGFRDPAGRDRWNRFCERTAAAIEADGLAALGIGAEVDPTAHRSPTALALAARGILTQSDAVVLDGLGGIGVPVGIVVGARTAASGPAASTWRPRSPAPP